MQIWLTAFRTLRLADKDASPRRVIYAARALRGFGDGFAIILVPVYLSEIGYGPAAIGFIATCALLGSATTTLAVGVLGRRHELRTLLLLGAAAMAATGLVVPAVEALAIVAVVAFVGTINPSGSDIGMLVPLEHASLARDAAPEQRTRTFARYSLIGATATAAGSLAAAVPQFMSGLSIEPVSAIRGMFLLYALLGVTMAALYARIPRRPPQQVKSPPPVLGQSRGIVIKLAALFSVDAFAGGFVVQSLLALWLFERFDLSLAQASLFFFWSNVLTAFSYPVAAWLAQRVGLVNTMVFTHLPSSLCLIAAAFAPNLATALTLLLIRSALSQMDVPTRTSYVMAVVTKEEQPAAASFTAVPRSLASSISPAFAGMLLASGFPGLPLIVCGALKIAYDLALLYSFRHIRPPEEQAAAPAPSSNVRGP